MSKGSPIVPVRIPADLLAEVERVIAARNGRAAGAPWSRSEFIVLAVREKLSKMERSRTSHKKGKSRAGADEMQAGDQAGDLQPE